MKPITVSIQSASADIALASYSTDYFVFSFNNSRFGKFHYHTSYEFEILIEGEMEVHVNSDKYHCSPGWIWMVQPTDFHQCIPLKENAKLISIKFNEKALTKEILTRFKNNYTPLVKSTSEDEADFINSEIDSLFVKLGKINSQSFERTLIKCALSQMIGKLFDTSQDDIAINHTVFPENLIKSVEFVKNNHTEKLSRDAVAAKFNFSPAYYSTLFKKYTGKSFSDFVLAEKLNHAYYMLLSTDLPIGEISKSVGFESFAYFTKAFKKAYGQTPTTARVSTDGMEM